MDARDEIRDFLSPRRAKITPEQAGLPAYGGAHRRVPGLRREDIAMLAGVAGDYFVRLERGNLTTHGSPAWTRPPATAGSIGSCRRRHRRHAAHSRRPQAPRQGPADPVGELSTRSGDFRTRWARHNVHEHLRGNKAINIRWSGGSI